MKKRRVLSVLAAMALAATSIIAPKESGFGYGVVASAVNVVEDGGLTLTKVGATGEDVKVTDTKYVNSLKPGDQVQLNINIPKLGVDLISMDLRVSYDPSLFYVYQWYRREADDSESETIKYDVDPLEGVNSGKALTTTANWPKAGTYVSGTDGEAYYKDGNLIITCSGEAAEGDDPSVRKITNFKNLGGAGTNTDLNCITLTAILQVKGTVKANTPFEFKIVMKEDGVVPANGIDGTSFDYAAAGNEKNDALWESIWKPKDLVAGTNPELGAKSVTGGIKKTITGTIGGIDFDYYKDELADKPLKIQVLGTLTGANNSAWIDDEQEDVLLDTITVNSDGSFEIKGLDPGKKYTLKINAWCLNDTHVIDEALNTTGMTQTIPEWTLKLYGDVDGDEIVGASDATQILKFIVGKSSMIQYKNSGGNVTDEYTAANVFDSDAINARDATQILRRYVELTSIFDDKHLTAF